MSTDTKNCKETENVPVNLEDVKILYKYSAWNNNAYRRVRFGEFYFPDRNELNDLYDLSLHPRRPPEGTIEEILAYHEGVKDRFIRTSIQTGHSITEINNRYEELRKQIIKNPKKFHDNLLQILDDKTGEVRILSLAADRWCDVLMWAHYGNSNKGVCIGINAEKLYEWLKANHSKESNGKVMIIPFKVNYVNGYSEVDIPNIYTDKGFDKCIENIFTHKYTVWEYEREVRLIMTKNNERQKNEDEIESSQHSDKERTIHLPLDCIEEVYVGAKCSEENLTDVRNALAISNVGTRLYQIVQGEEQFTLDRKEIAY